jgi:hypothetical protein
MYDRKFSNKLDMWEYERVVVTLKRDNKESVTNTGAAAFSPTNALAVKYYSEFGPMLAVKA